MAATTTLNYDGNGNLSQVNNPLQHATNFAYDLFDRLSMTTDTLGNKSVRTYDKNSNVLSAEAQDPGSITVARTELMYDEMSRAFETRRWISGPVGDPANYIVMKRLYDKNSRLTRATDDNGHMAVVQYDNASRRALLTDANNNTVQLQYDLNSNVTQVVSTEQQPGTGPQTFTRGFAFDEIDRLVSMRDQGADGIFNNTDDRSSAVKYDSRGNVTTQTDTKGTLSKFAYDALNRRTQVQVDPAGLNIVTQWAFDNNSRLTKYTGIRNNADAQAQVHATTCVYDRLDRQKQTVFADGKSIVTTFDAAGNVLTSTDQNGSIASMTYDTLERMTAISIARAGGVNGTTARTYNYDALSRMKQATDNNDPADISDDTDVSWAFDGLSRPMTETQKYGMAGSPTINKAVGYSFNDGAATPDRQNLSKITYPDSTIERFGHDVLDRIDNVYLGDNTSNKLAGYTYAGFGRTASQTNYTGTAAASALGITSLEYDGVKRATSLYNRMQGGTELASFDYGYDKADNRVCSKFVHAGGAGEIYRYDKGYRLTESYLGASAGDIASAITAVSNGNDPAAASAYGQKDIYALDNLGNRASVLEAGVNGANPETTSYTSSQATSDYKMNRITTVGAAVNVYDGNGNVKDDGTLLYGFDAFNRITTVTRKSDSQQIASYKYDALGRRVRKTVSNMGTLNGTTHFVYQGQMVLEEHAVTNPGATETLAETARYINGRGIDERICMERQDITDIDNNGNTTEFQRFYYYTDALGSVRAVTWVQTGTNIEKLVERVDYDVYGKATFANWGADKTFGTGDDATSNASIIGNPFLFTGQRHDPETGNYYYKMRYYQSSTGMFLSQDPLGYINGPNMYQYCGSNPANYTDPMGLCKGGFYSDLWDSTVDLFDTGLDAAASFSQEFGDALTGGRASEASDFYAHQFGIYNEYRYNETAGILGNATGQGVNAGMMMAGGVGVLKGGVAILEGGANLLEGGLTALNSGGKLALAGAGSMGGGAIPIAGSLAAIAEGAITAAKSGAVGAIGEYNFSQGGGEGAERPLGSNGAQTPSKTVYKGDGKERIDVENPNPGQRPGQIHYQDNAGNKYIYDVGKGTFPNAPKKVNDLLNDPRVKKAIEKGKRILGV